VVNSQKKKNQKKICLKMRELRLWSARWDHAGDVFGELLAVSGSAGFPLHRRYTRAARQTHAGGKGARPCGFIDFFGSFFFPRNY
jgi:hypothetical protein